MDEWFADTQERFPSPGEISVPAISLLYGLIGGNGISAIVQCGHYVGYSTLLLGFLLRSMGKEHSLFSVDIDADVTAYTQRWIEKANLQEQVRLHVGDSADESLPQLAGSFLGKAPQIVLIDSSHQYAHTLRELELWYGALQPGGLLFLHDVSIFAQTYDSTSAGGVYAAAHEWAVAKGLKSLFLNDFVDGSQSVESLVYRDGCGFGVFQKR